MPRSALTTRGDSLALFAFLTCFSATFAPLPGLDTIDATDSSAWNRSSLKIGTFSAGVAAAPPP